MPGFVVNGNQYTSGRNVIMGKETLTLEDAKQQIKALGEENDNFVFKNAELLEEIEAWRKETAMVRQEMTRRKTVYDEVRKEFASVNAERDKLILVQIKQIDELKSEIKQQEDIWFDWKQKYNALAHPETVRNYWTRYEVNYELKKWQRELEKTR